ncbi:hypothetical protein L0B53_02215 [Vibrio sp. SS-MA-C1-2]|uniref:acyl-CoA thioesterase n=1 Tax=Vibrio sp. SS-MA-C1-2 TaxID=2908646 RepID=UPI001F36D291|nr:hotdog domain-containing protein [Vibrio sp. SS-MA-C1-2]UJF17605.1 hypothetical protein L0B53_02215 [Vibrio sp. SS-MA-C1-2]
MQYLGRRLIKSEDLNSAGCLFGGTLMRWLDEEAYIYARCQLQQDNIVTKLISEISFETASVLGDIIEFGMETTAVGNSSITFSANVRNKATKKTVLNVDKIVMVNVNNDGKPTSHGWDFETLKKSKS